MTFDGAFHVPSWLRQLAIQPIDLIAHCRREEGGEYGVPNEGAVALAKWLLDDAVRAEREARRPGSPLFMGGVINRLLAGAILPSSPLAESVALMTGGAVTFDMFERQAAGVPDESDLAALPVPDPEPQPQPEPVLGEVASGPLWRARERGNRVIVSGAYGVDMTLTRVSGEKLWRDLHAIFAPPGEPARSYMGVY